MTARFSTLLLSLNFSFSYCQSYINIELVDLWLEISHVIILDYTAKYLSNLNEAKNYRKNFFKKNNKGIFAYMC